MKNLQLPLTREYFEMTDTGEKTEDYREITDYWCRRLLELREEPEFATWNELIEDLANPNRKHKDVNECLSYFGARFKMFDRNIMTLGYPKKTDFNRKKIFKNEGIEIRTGKPEWGAKLYKLYFVIKHGEKQ